MQRNEPKPDQFDLLLRVGGFALVGFVVLIAASGMLSSLDVIARSALSVFVAGLATNLLLVCKWGGSFRLPLADFGLGWPPRHFASGFALGAAAVGILIVGAILARSASFQSAPVEASAWPLALLLLAGALGEEMLFRGFAFQYLVREWNQSLTIIGSAVLFGLVHLSNNNVQPLGAANTVLWGALLGYAYTRARTLWLPVGIHFGWNLALTLFTSNLSGTTIRATGWDLQWSSGELWSGGSYGLEGGLLATIAALPVFFLVRRVR